MKDFFSIFQNPLQLSHQFWLPLLKRGSTVIDATSGNGHDTLFLAREVLTPNSGKVYAIDIQQEALEQTKARIEAAIGIEAERIHYTLGCHSSFPHQITPESVQLTVYNLGYLPGGDKSVTTRVETTLKSVESALLLTAPGGAVSITCYPGHKAGEVEEKRLTEFAQELNKGNWSCSYHRWLNRDKSPSLLFLQKKQLHADC